MKTREVLPLTQVFVSIPDPRNSRQIRHDLSELLTVAACAVLCSADEKTLQATVCLTQLFKMLTKLLH